MLGSYLVFLATGTTTSYPVILASLILMGAGFALAYPALNIEALAGIADRRARDSHPDSSAARSRSEERCCSRCRRRRRSHSRRNMRRRTKRARLSCRNVCVAVAGAGAIALIASTTLLVRRRRRVDPPAVPALLSIRAPDRATRIGGDRARNHHVRRRRRPRRERPRPVDRRADRRDPARRRARASAAATCGRTTTWRRARPGRAWATRRSASSKPSAARSAP